MLRKNLLSLVAAGALTTALSMSAFAGGPTTEMPAQAESGFTLGLNYSNMLQLPVQNLASNFALMAGYVNDSFLADFGVNYDSYSVASVSISSWEMRGDLGLRYMLNNTLFFTYGATGAYNSNSDNSGTIGKNPYAVGAFVGLDYQPMNHLLLSFKIDPYLYSSTDLSVVGITTHNNYNRVFSAGSIGASYIFS